MSAADRIAETILRMGDIRAQGLQRAGDIQARQQAQSGQIWGGAIAQLGQLPVDIQKAKVLDTENQIRQNALQQQKKFQDDEFNANQIFAYTTRPDADGSIKFDEEKLNSLTQKMAEANVNPETQQRVMQAFKQGNSVVSEFRQSQLDHQVKVAKLVLGSATPDNPLTPTTALTTLKWAQANGIASADDVNKFMAGLNQGHSPEDLFKAIIQYGTNPPSALDAAKLRTEQLQGNKLEAEIPGVAAKSQQEQNVVAGMQDGRTAAQRADDERQAAGLAKEQAAQAETVRHNQALEAAQKLQYGREAAVNAETARHNKVMEGQNNPLATIAPTAGANLPDVAPGQKNDAFLKTLPPPIADKVKAVVEGRLQLPVRIAKGDTYWQGVIDAAVKYDPSFDAVNYNARSKTRADFTSGKSAQQVNALNTAIGHMDRLLQVTDALGNLHEGSLGPLTTTANEVKNWFSQNFGSKAVPSFNVVRKAVADELTRVWRQAGGSEQDIQENLRNMSSSNTPEQLYGAVGEFGHLLESKLDNLKEQYRQGMGTDPVNMVTPEARRVLDKVEGKAGGGSSGVSVKAPNGQTYTFPTAADAAAFKARAGIK